MPDPARWAEYICKKAPNKRQRTGQFLFNQLPNHISTIVAGKMFDPFYADLSEREVQEWINDHLIFNGQEIIGVFDGDNLLWEKPVIERVTRGVY